MIFFIKLIYALLPILFFYGFFKSIYKIEEKLFTSILIMISLFLGIFIQKLAISYLYDLEVITFFRTFLLLALVIFIFSIKLSKKRPIFYFIVFCLFLYASSDFINSIKDLPLSSTEVINSAFIINISYILIGICFSYYISLAVNRFYSSFKDNKVLNTLFLISFSLFVIDVIGKIILFLLKKDLIELTSLRLSFVAKTTYFNYINIYFYIFVLIFLCFHFYLFYRNQKIDKNLKSAMKRKIQRIIINRFYWIKSTIFSISLLLSMLLYYDLYASQGISLSEDKMLIVNKDNNFVLNIEEHMDGDLYRYSYITQNGKKIRFFLINRYPGQEKITAVFDACMICGDLGYVKEDNQVICIACGVRVFIPSIGKQGGCNPIPFKFSKKDGKLIIPLQEILQGDVYFSEIIDIEVIDPISKNKLINTKSDYIYDYKGKSFYFENEKNMEIFKENPKYYSLNKIIKKQDISMISDEEKGIN